MCEQAASRAPRQPTAADIRGATEEMIALFLEGSRDIGCRESVYGLPQSSPAFYQHLAKFIVTFVTKHPEHAAGLLATLILPYIEMLPANREDILKSPQGIAQVRAFRRQAARA